MDKVCHQKGIEFHCFKFISDNANDAAAENWIQQMVLGARLLS